MESHIFFWLRFVRQCPVVLFERSPRQDFCGKPDVLGVTQSRYLIEFECKRSMSDYRANAAKKSQIHRRDGYRLDLFPRQYYFCVTEQMIDRAKDELPEYAGIVSCGGRDGLVFHKNAPILKESKRLSLKECVKLSKAMCSQFYCHFQGHNHVEMDWGLEYRI